MSVAAVSDPVPNSILDVIAQLLCDWIRSTQNARKDYLQWLE